MSPEAVKNFLTTVALPLVVGALSTWLFATVHVFSLFGITEGQVSGELTQLGTFGISAAITFLFAHFHLSGNYTPGAKAAKAGPPLSSFGAPLGHAVLGEVKGNVRESTK